MYEIFEFGRYRATSTEVAFYTTRVLDFTPEVRRDWKVTRTATLIFSYGDPFFVLVGQTLQFQQVYTDFAIFGAAWFALEGSTHSFPNIGDCSSLVL